MSEMFVLAIDHRNSLRQWLRSLLGEHHDEYELIVELKSVVLDGLLTALAHGITRSEVALLVDSEYGRSVIAGARDEGVAVIVPVEESGQAEFSFEYGNRFAEQIDEISPDLVKALVRYNPAGDASRNARSRRRLGQLQRQLQRREVPWVLELLVPAEKAQLAALDNQQDRYDREVRLGVTLGAIDHLMGSGLRPDYWKLEGYDDVDACQQIASAVTYNHGGRCLVLGRGQDQNKVGRWIVAAAKAEGFAGFAVGRTIWEQPVADWILARATRAGAVAAIAERYVQLVELFLAARRTHGGQIVSQSRDRSEGSSESVPGNMAGASEPGDSPSRQAREESAYRLSKKEGAE